MIEEKIADTWKLLNGHRMSGKKEKIPDTWKLLTGHRMSGGSPEQVSLSDAKSIEQISTDMTLCRADVSLYWALILDPGG